MIKFTDEHEWLNIDGDVATVGITDYAQNALGDVVFVELPEVGSDFAKGDEVSVVESVKAASEVYAPATGEIIEVNETLEGEPGLVNSAAESDGWFFKIKLSDMAELEDMMDADGYKTFVEGL